MVKIEKIQKWLDKITELDCDGIGCEECPLHTNHIINLDMCGYKWEHKCIANLISDIKGADRNP